MSFLSNIGQTFGPAPPTAATAPSNFGWAYGLSSGLSALGEFASGVSAFQQGNAQAGLYQEQAGMALKEALAAAQQKAREVGEFQSQQVMDYAHSGVRIEGSPVHVLERTRKLGQQEVDAIVSQGKAQAKLLAMQGAMAKTGARNALIGGIFGAGTSGLSSYMQAKRIGLYGNQSSVSDQLSNVRIGPGGLESTYGRVS